ncbi:hypothetical protein Sjap_020132 [Stephania japonica]|uniref:Uncharacterized protein n=1 Tax=Stephania japonica TaxID=461633 RepID=A0AAP0F7I9_9MAGN
MRYIVGREFKTPGQRPLRRGICVGGKPSRARTLKSSTYRVISSVKSKVRLTSLQQLGITWMIDGRADFCFTKPIGSFAHPTTPLQFRDKPPLVEDNLGNNGGSAMEMDKDNQTSYRAKASEPKVKRFHAMLKAKPGDLPMKSLEANASRGVTEESRRAVMGVSDGEQDGYGSWMLARR